MKKVTVYRKRDGKPITVWDYEVETTLKGLVKKQKEDKSKTKEGKPQTNSK